LQSDLLERPITVGYVSFTVLSEAIGGYKLRSDQLERFIIMGCIRVTVLAETLGWLLVDIRTTRKAYHRWLCHLFQWIVLVSL
jgi:hypothetical protein